MKKLVTYTSLLLTGVVLGWWLRDVSPGVEPRQTQAPFSSSNTPVIISSQSELTKGRHTAKINAPPVSEVTRSPDKARFEQLLHEQQFEQAIAYYENALKIDDGYQALWKPALEGYLRASLDQCASAAFVELVDLWLNAYYEDIPVLLLLAENQRLCNSPEEAARTLQIARTYAMQPGSQGRVTAAVTRLITATDESLSQQKNWIALLGFFEFLQTIDLSTNYSELRRASLYQLVGENLRSTDLLLELRELDDGGNAEWTAALNLQWSKNATQPPADELPAHAIALTRKGDHFLVPTLIDGRRRVVLMIDTGASVTTLTRDSFNQIDSSDFIYRGSRLFNTANGMAQGDVYQTTSLTLGNTQVSSAEIAVLDYQSADGIDGLLGMNVLRNYRFEIDQDKDVLYLHPRQ